MSKTTTTSGATGQGMSRSTTIADANTGQSKTFNTGQAYADKEGNVYRNSDNGWEQHSSSGWQSASKPPESVQNEAQARSQGEERYNNYRQSSAGSSWSRPSGGAVRGGFRR
jgi:hypothetical protein